MALTDKQEKFCLLVTEGHNPSEAYRLAYPNQMSPKTVNEVSCKVMKNPKIISRIAELRRPAVVASQMTLEMHLEDLRILRDKAANQHQYGAAITAEIARGKAAGIVVEKRELTGLNGAPLIPPTCKLTIVRKNATQ